MLLYRKSGKIFEILSFPGEEINKGGYLVVEDKSRDIKLLLQVIEINYIDAPGLLEELIREGFFLNNELMDEDPYQVSRTTMLLRDTKLLTCVLRGAIMKDKLVPSISELPSRSASIVKKISTASVTKLNNSSKDFLGINLGLDEEETPISLNAHALDGALTLITGMKGTGKSHLAKILVSSLTSLGAPVLVLDLNGEYIGLTGKENIQVYIPGRNLVFSPKYLGKESFLKVLMNILGLPGVSANIFNELWPIMEEKNLLTISEMISFVNRAINNLMIRDAIVSRLLILRSMCFMRDNDATPLESIFDDTKGVIIVLKGLSSLEKKALVEILLNKLVRLLEQEMIPPLFLFAEEAHMYIRDTYWEDIITRMRHFGLYVIFITNQPDSLDHQVFRQLDNLFIFRFMNDHDLDMLAKVSNIDSQTVKSIARDLQIGQCLVVGKAVNNLPITIKILRSNFDPMGRTKRVFNHIWI
jgi:hypothetical protein